MHINTTGYITYTTRLAQLVERTPFKRVVVGSSPTSGESDETTIKVLSAHVV